MKSPYYLVLTALLLALPFAGQAENTGRGDFERHCSGCHPEGGNPLNPAKTLHRQIREANGVKTAADIVRIMRKPGQGMKTYTREDISDKRAKSLAEYILATF